MTPEKLATWMIKTYGITLDNLLVAQSIANIVVIHVNVMPIAVERPVYEEIMKQLIEKENPIEH